MASVLTFSGSQSQTGVQNSKSQTISSSGQTTVTPDSGYTSMQQAVITVPAGVVKLPSSITSAVDTPTISGGVLTLTKTINSAPVVQTSGFITSGTSSNSVITLSTFAANLAANNIKKDIDILGITGTYDGEIPRLITNDTSITPTGTYATATYYNQTYGVKIGYVYGGDIIISMKGGTTTSYENIIYTLASAPSGVSISYGSETTWNASVTAGHLYCCVISGLTSPATLALAMNAQSASDDTVTVSITLTSI